MLVKCVCPKTKPNKPGMSEGELDVCGVVQTLKGCSEPFTLELHSQYVQVGLVIVVLSSTRVGVEPGPTNAEEATLVYSVEIQPYAEP